MGCPDWVFEGLDAVGLLRFLRYQGSTGFDGIQHHSNKACGERRVDVKGEGMILGKTLIHQGFQHTWVRNPLSEKHECIASRKQDHP